MKRIWKEFAIAAVISLVVPWVMVCTVGYLQREKPKLEEPVPTVEGVETQPSRLHETIDVWKDGQLQNMFLDEYITGVLLAELPGSFHIEAKKAQAVVARTYALRTAENNGKHPGAVCTDSGCCQGYLDPAVFTDRGGDGIYIEQARQAVADTAGLVLTYEGELIEATYFSCSGGKTEDAVAVWGTDVPYLRSVVSPGEEGASVYEDTVIFSVNEFQKALGVTISGDPDTWFGTVDYTEGNGVASMQIGGRQYTGTQLRQKLGLRSTAFTVEVTSQGIRITTKGFGHRVGMSQYGADAMAKSGSTFRQILAHYYPGTVLLDR